MKVVMKYASDLY